jgi:hypothetical protein
MRRRDAQPDPDVVHALRELDAALAGEPAADPELAVLVADVRAERAEPSAAFLASLDARVHAGFPPAGPRRPRWHERLRAPQVLVPSVIGTLAAALVALVVVTGGGGANDSSSSSSSSSGSASVSAQAPAREDAAGDSASSSASAQAKSAPGAPSTALAAPAPSAPSAAPRKVQRAAELTLTPAPGDVQATADGVVRETQAAGGYVQRSDIATRDGGGGGEASFTLRIPSARLDETLARLSKLAHVGALSQSSTDITAQVASAADELSDARAERRALLRALGRATTDRQIAALRARLRDNRSEIAARKGALEAQRRRADLATVAVTVQGTGQAHQGGGGAWTPGDALHDAGRVLEVAGGVAVVGLAVLAPLALLAALALLAGRSVRRHRRETALDRAI